jgi:hypothetical protein
LAQAWQSRHKSIASGAEAPLTDLERLLYLSLRNLGDLEAARLAAGDGDGDDGRQACIALYSDALLLDDADPLIWLKLSEVASSGGTAAVARAALERGLQLHPGHPLLLDALLQLLLQVRPSY